MALSHKQREELEKRRPENVRVRLAQHAGAGDGSVVPGLGDGMMLRRDVEDWLSVHDQAAAKLQTNTYWRAKVGAIIGAIGILTAIVIAALGR